MKPHHRPIHARVRYLLKEGFSITARPMEDGTLYVFAFMSIADRATMNAWFDRELQSTGSVRLTWMKAWLQYECEKSAYIFGSYEEAEEVLAEIQRYAVMNRGTRS